MTTTGVAIVLILWRVLKTASGKKLVSDCCGKKASIGFQVGEMTPLPSGQNPPLPKMTENPMIKDIVSIPVDSCIAIEGK
jgi:hypothetical protein